MSVQVVLVYNKANPFGIKQDSEILESMIAQYNQSVGITFAKVKHADLLEPPMPCDVCIHLEIPSAMWMPFAHTNILMVNSEWWVPAWDCLLPKFDQVLYKIKTTDISGGTFIPWCAPQLIMKQQPAATDLSAGCLWLLGGSKNKREFAETLLPLWKESYPTLAVYTTSPLDLSGNLPSNVSLTVKDLESDERWRLQRYYPVHMCASKSEGFGLAAAEAEKAGAFTILNNIDSYTSNFTGDHVAFLETPLISHTKYTRARFADLSGCDLSLERQLDTIMMRVWEHSDFKTVRAEQADKATQRTEACRQALVVVLKKAVSTVQNRKAMITGPYQIPPALPSDLCPYISVVTLSYNRRKFIDLAFHNIILTDYPKDKIEWVIVDDSTIPEEQISDKIASFAKRAPVSQIVYVPLAKKHSIGYKRNLGVERSTNPIILFMDDDDHYPETSFRRRVAWLTKHPWMPKAVGCSTIACYDLVHGLSAVNTPPWELRPAERVSEATLTFYKTFWEAQKFPQVNSSEGEGFLNGREGEFLEIPPQQILVAFSHQGNSSGRRIPIPKDMKPGCFWGFPKEYLVWIHKLAGIEVEEETELTNTIVKNQSTM